MIRTGVEKGRNAGFEAERNGFGELSATPQSKGLIGLFRGQTECKKNRFGNPPKPAKTIGVLGAGLMGAGKLTKCKHLFKLSHPIHLSFYFICRYCPSEHRQGIQSYFKRYK